jgi:hypothetical protein
MGDIKRKKRNILSTICYARSSPKLSKFFFKNRNEPIIVTVECVTMKMDFDFRLIALQLQLLKISSFRLLKSVKIFL